MYIKCTGVWENTCLFVWNSHEKLPRAISAPAETLKDIQEYSRLVDRGDRHFEDKEDVSEARGGGIYRNHRDAGKSLRYSWQGLVPMSHFRKKEPTKFRKAFALYPKNS